jgi:predicted nucleic acid-binding protein
MVVIADTSPLNYLVLIDAIDVLRPLYGRVIIPAEVLAELQHPQTPQQVLDWSAHLPDWMEVVPASTVAISSELAELDAGECAAITLAAEYGRRALLLIDDARARQEASRRGLLTVGTIGILRDAATENLIDLRTAFDRLRRTSFRGPAEVMQQLLTHDENRKNPTGE